MVFVRSVSTSCGHIILRPSCIISHSSARCHLNDLRHARQPSARHPRPIHRKNLNVDPLHFLADIGIHLTVDFGTRASHVWKRNKRRKSVTTAAFKSITRPSSCSKNLQNSGGSVHGKPQCPGSGRAKNVESVHAEVEEREDTLDIDPWEVSVPVCRLARRIVRTHRPRQFNRSCNRSLHCVRASLHSGTDARSRRGPC